MNKIIIVMILLLPFTSLAQELPENYEKWGVFADVSCGDLRVEVRYSNDLTDFTKSHVMWWKDNLILTRVTNLQDKTYVTSSLSGDAWVTTKSYSILEADKLMENYLENIESSPIRLENLTTCRKEILSLEKAFRLRAFSEFMQEFKELL